MMLASVEKSVVAVSAVAEAVLSVVCPPTTRLPEAERLVEDALARVVCPETVRVPLEVRELVKIPSVARRSAVKKEFVDVALVKDADRAVRREEKKVEEVAFVNEAEVEKRFVLVLFVRRAFVATRLVLVLLLLVRLEMVPEEEVRLAIVAEEIVVVASEEVAIT